MNKLRSILVGVDFTPGSGAALRQAIRLAQAVRGEGVESGDGGGEGAVAVHALHVINTHVVIDLQHALSPLQKNIQASLETEARRMWLKFEHRLAGKEAIDLRIRVGNPAAALADEVHEAGIDLLVLGIHADAGAHQSGAGTVAGACVRKADTRVLLVRPEQTAPFRRVLACVDFSELSRVAVLEAARVARLESASLDILHVFQPPWRQLHYFAPMPENSPEFQAGYRAYVVEKVRNFCEPLKPHLEGVPHSFKLEEHHSSGGGIIEYAGKNPIDLMVMGAQGRSDLRDFILGSTVERVLRQTPCSMLTVRHAK